MMRRGLRLVGEDATLALGARLGAALRGGETVCLYGVLGGGKTTLVRGMMRGLGYRGCVSSPTFALVHEYRTRGRPRVCHMDLYRLGAEEVEGIGLADILAEPRSVCVIEWPQAASAMLPADRLEVRFAHARAGRRGEARIVRFRCGGRTARELLSRAVRA